MPALMNENQIGSLKFALALIVMPGEPCEARREGHPFGSGRAQSPDKWIAFPRIACCARDGRPGMTRWGGAGVTHEAAGSSQFLLFLAGVLAGEFPRLLSVFVREIRSRALVRS